MQSKKDNKGRKLYKNENQMKDGRYRFRYTDPKGERRAIYSWKLVPTDKTPKGKRDDISLREKEKMVQKDLDDGINTELANRTVDDLIVIYLRTKVKLAISTAENYEYMWKKDIKGKWFGTKKLKDVKRSDVLQLYANFYKVRKFKVGTIQLYQNMLYPAFQMAVDDGIIRLNPCRNCMKEYTTGSMSSNKVPLTEEEQEILLEHLQSNQTRYSRYYTFVLLMLRTGVRIGEALGLTWSDIDLQNRILNVDHQLIYKRNKGGCKLYIAVPKQKRERKIPLPSDLCAALQIYKQNTYFISLASGCTLDGYSNFVFLNSRMHLNKPSTINRAFLGIRDEYNKVEVAQAIEEGREAKPLPRFSAHVLRHTFCTRMASNGMDVKVLQEIMGHANIQVTMQVYNHADVKRLQSEVDRLDMEASSLTQ